METIDPMVIPQLPNDRFSCLMFSAGRMFAVVFISMEIWDMDEVDRWRDGERRNAGCRSAWSVEGYWKEAKGEEEQDMKWHLSPKNCQNAAEVRAESLKRKEKGIIQFIKVDVSQNTELKKSDKYHDPKSLFRKPGFRVSGLDFPKYFGIHPK